MDDISRRKNPPKDRSSLVWMVSFLVLMFFFYWLDQTPWFQEGVVARLSRWTAEGTVFILGFLGLSLSLAGSTITGPSMRLEIAASCSGSFVFLMFAAAVIPFPVPWKVRFKGLFLGFLTLLLINLLRISLIVLVVNRFPGALWTFHIVIGQVMVIAAMMGVFLWWAKDRRGETSDPFLKNKRTIFRFLLLFCVGYVGGYILYGVFLESPLGFFVKELIERHTFGILAALKALAGCGELTPFAGTPVKLLEGCLSSPMVVLFAAVVFAWPARWGKRVLVISLGFIPFFYGYHLLRALLVTLTLAYQAKDFNLVYNFYGQVFLVLFSFGVLAYFRCARQKIISSQNFFWAFVFSCAVALPVTAGLGWISNHWLIPWVVKGITGSTLLAYDPEQTVSTMPAVWTFIWLILMGTTPRLTTARKIVFSGLGVLMVLILYAATVILFETFHMAPHKGFLKLFVTILPFAVYGACCLFLWNDKSLNEVKSRMEKESSE